MRALFLLAIAAACCSCGSDYGKAPSAGDAPIAHLRLGAVLGEPDAAGFARADRPRVFEFPQDHGAHPDYRSEWWYLTLMLNDASGAEFGAQFTVFRQALRPGPAPADPWQSGQVYLGHFAVTDVARNLHLEDERLARGHPELAGVQAQPFRLWLDGWQLGARDQSFAELALAVRTDRVTARLRLDAIRPVVLQGEQGLSAKGPGQASYYYSVPRLAVGGELVIDGRAHQVSGSGWLDREWSTSMLSADQLGWDWFALQLDDGTDLMAFRLRRADGARDPYDHGLRVRPDGSALALTAQDFTLVPLDHWTDERGVSWPIGWRVMLPDRQLLVRAALEDQRMDTTLTYWEGLVGVFDQSGRRVGRGYMELTGYGQEG